MFDLGKKMLSQSSVMGVPQSMVYEEMGCTL